MGTTYLPFVLAVLLAVVKAIKLQVEPLAANDTLKAAVKNAEPLFNTHITAGLEETPVFRAAKASLLRRHDFFFQINSSMTLDLKNVHVVEGPNFKVTSVSADLEFLNMAVEGSVGTIVVDGNFSISSLSNLKRGLSPVVGEGNFRLAFESVAFKGFTGLRVDGDRLLTVNSDIDYVPAAVILAPQHLTDHGPVSSEISLSSFEDAVSAKIKSQLRSSMNRHLKKQLDAVASKCSLAKLLLDDDTTIATFRSHSQSLNVNVNELVDDLIIEIIKDQTKDTNGIISIPDKIHASFSKKGLLVTWHGSFTATDAWAKDLTTIVRTGDMSITYDSGVLTIFGALKLGELAGGFQYYRAEFMGIGPEGYMNASVGFNALFFKVSVDISRLTDPKTTIKELYIEDIYDIDFEVTGLWPLTWLLSKIGSWVVDYYTDKVAYHVNKYLLDTARKLISPSDYLQ